MRFASRRSPRLAYVVVTVWGLAILLPFYWLIITSLKSDQDLVTSPKPVPWLHFDPTIKSYEFLVGGDGSSLSGASFNFDRFAQPFMNSLVVGVGSAVIALVVGSLAAYALARFDLGRQRKVNQVVAYGFLSTRMIPPAILLIPYLIMAREVGLLDTRLSLTLVYAAGGTPYTIWILREFYLGIPIALEESAMLDGASTFQIYRKIILPLARPGHIAMFILLLIGAWNELLIALTLTFTEAATLPLFLVLQNESMQGPTWGDLSAVTLLSMLPMLVIGVGLQRWIRSGLTVGAVK